MKDKMHVDTGSRIAFNRLIEICCKAESELIVLEEREHAKATAEGETPFGRSHKVHSLFVYEVAWPVDNFFGMVGMVDYFKAGGGLEDLENGRLEVLGLAYAAALVAGPSELRHQPYIFCLPVPTNGVLGLVWKQDNNGACYISCPREVTNVVGQCLVYDDGVASLTAAGDYSLGQIGVSYSNGAFARPAFLKRERERATQRKQGFGGLLSDTTH